MTPELSGVTQAEASASAFFIPHPHPHPHPTKNPQNVRPPTRGARTPRQKLRDNTASQKTAHSKKGSAVSDVIYRTQTRTFLKKSPICKNYLYLCNRNGISFFLKSEKLD